MNKKKFTLMAVAALCAGLLTACTTTTRTPVIQPDGSTNIVVTKTPDIAKTEKVVAFSEGILTMGMRRALDEFPKEADTIAFYGRAVGSVFCDMQATRQFSPESFEAAIAALVLPQIEDDEARRLMLDLRDIMKLTYRSFWADRFKAELPPDEWPAKVADVFCNSIHQALVDSGRPGVKSPPPPLDDGTKAALRKALEQAK